ncbi:asparaginase [Curvibacter sp. APW13]|uniref:asparaginase n=1 Tax=Curvibacter sp. APW13 TaxID=3077236 RepID=UPI0028DF8F18|nr:asparaginase [Curvibacter sp. APW13]MDT8992167.1 asparaginase [Curvibacter sp. APW13]
MVVKREIVVLGMGGTIAGRASRASDNVGYVAGEVPVDVLVNECLAGSLDPMAWQVLCEQVVQKDSKDMVFDDWALLAQRVAHHLRRAEVAGVVVTHGTDTLEEGAYFLHLTIPQDLQQAKPLVMTCAMRPASALAPDGPQNLRDAVAAVQDGRAAGVVVVCGGEVHAATRVRKTHTYSTRAFASVGGGVLGYVEEGCVRWCDACATLLPGAGAHVLPERPARWPRVEVLLSYSEASADLIDALLAYQGPNGAVDGLVLAATGNGTVHSALEPALGNAQRRGVRVALVSRCADGALVGAGLEGRAFALGQVVSPYQARIALVLQLLTPSKP